ncbi:hypothetical protein LWI28_013378 [Acer negundo]|uniref:Uncharacterized protein n=1 Tax=Acer negundo TaxID=4023 RepID=A0AAD5J5N5_ACENE|nr:hypothetical protein LWI28_013378 [Acer negundo]KAK4851673.1 hypothetical protein QYF36_017394 [Acer negundo]
MPLASFGIRAGFFPLRVTHLRGVPCRGDSLLGGSGTGLTKVPGLYRYLPWRAGPHERKHKMISSFILIFYFRCIEMQNFESRCCIKVFCTVRRGASVNGGISQ